MLEYLFGSKTRVKLLRLFFRDSDRKWFVRELTRELGVQINAVRRELHILEKADLIIETAGDAYQTTERPGSRLRKYYRVDKASLLFPEMQALLLKAQLLGEQAFIGAVKQKCGNIKLFILSGQFTGADHLKTDMILVGDIKIRTLDKVIIQYEKEFGFAIRYTVMTEREFSERRDLGDKFIFSLFEARHLTAIDELNM